ncbi:MAG: ABC transporter ATP-binding protein [Kiritimatiellae bacterium]|nr:ABC transporter ATP-binding protein [Kiritimatiellia bacterium]
MSVAVVEKPCAWEIGAEPPARITSRVLLRDAWRVLWTYPAWFTAQLAATILFSVAEPSLSWVARDAVGTLEKAGGALARLALPHTGLYLGIALGLALLRMVERVTRKVYESTVVFALQRHLLRRRPVLNPTEDVTRMVYDCVEAKKALSPLYANIWRDLFRLAAVAGWQLMLAPAWLGALLASAAPGVLGPLFLTPLLQRAKRRVLEANCEVTAHVAEGASEGLKHRQRKLLRRFVVLETLTGAMEALLGLAEWVMLLILIVGARAWPLPLVPDRIALGDLAAVLVGLKLLNKPLRELGKSYATLRGNWPALMRTLYPHLPAGRATP